MKKRLDGFDLAKGVAKNLLPQGTVELGMLETPDESTHPALDSKGPDSLPKKLVGHTRTNLNRTIRPCNKIKKD